MPFCAFHVWVPFLKLNMKKKGTLIVKGLLRNLVDYSDTTYFVLRLDFKDQGSRCFSNVPFG